MRLDEFAFLLQPLGQQLLAEMAETTITPDAHLQAAAQLRKQVSPEQANAVLEMVILRQKAVAKFSRAAEMYFTRTALQQASAEVVSSYRARRYAKAGYRHVADLGCGIGGDSLTLAARFKVVGVDWDPLRLAMAQENVRAYGHQESFSPLQADLVELSALRVEALFADPGRRDRHGRRIHSVNEYRPPLGFLDRWRERVPHQGIKISPGVDYAELPVDCEAEFISVNGEVREAILWRGELRTGESRRATLLPSEATLTDRPVEPIAVNRPLAFLYEPDGAVIRAHLVEQLAQKIDASMIDPDIAYLTTDKALSTPFARCYAIEDVFRFQLKRLRRYLRVRDIGEVTIKKRGSPLDPQRLRARLRLRGVEQRVVFLTKVMGKPTVLVGREHEL